MNGIIKILVLSVLFTGNVIYAQDTIALKNNSKLLTEIVEVGLNDIKYRNYLNPGRITFSIAKSEVDYIIFSDGYKQKIEAGDTTKMHEPTGNMFIMGKVDAARFYDGYHGASTGTLVVSLLSPLVGLIPAIACSTTNPKPKNLGYPDTQLFHQIDYKRGYVLQSKRIKSKKVWRNWGIAFGVNIFLVIMTQQ
jgi:hypothetical protein